jgi:glycosyltransferase involved in cell wall biosynthesis
VKDAKISLDIILPCYNPEKNWEYNIISEIRKINTALPDVLVNLIIINDGSSKNLSDSLKHLAAEIEAIQIINLPENKGKGFALRKGFSIAESEFMIFTDIDFPFTTDSLIRIFDVLKSGDYDIVPGYRNDTYYGRVPRFRKFISVLFRKIIRAVLKIEVSDTQCGLKGFNRTGRELFLKTTIDRYLFDLELFMLAARNKSVRLKPVLVELKENIVFRKIGLRILITESLNFIKVFLRN